MSNSDAEATFSVGGKAFRLLSYLGDADIDAVLRNATVRKVGKHESITVTGPRGVVERMKQELADAAADRTQFDSCTRTQYRTAASRADSALSTTD